MSGFIDTATAADAATPAAGVAGSGFSLLLMVAFVGIFYFLLIRPQQKRMKETQAMLSRLATGDEVATAGGLLGKIAELGDTFLTLEIAEGVKVRVQRSAVTQVLPKGTIRNG